MKKKLMKNKNGQLLIVAIVFMVVILILSSTLFTRVALFLSEGSKSVLNEQSNYLAEAGVNYAVWQLNKTGGTFTSKSNVQVGTTGTFSVSLTGTSNLKTITSTGYIPNSILPLAKRTVKLDILISSEVIAFNYAVQVGAGGVSMANSSTINGSVYSNGNITGSGPSSINGDAYAVGTISTPPSVSGNLVPNSPPTTMPTVDYNFWETAANVNNNPIVCTPTCNISGPGNFSIGPQKYMGNLVISNQANVTINGPIYVTGFLTVQDGGTQINLNNSFGSNGSAIVTDGVITVQNGGTFNPTNANPKGYILVASTLNTNGTAISISNQGATAIFYALNGGALLQNQANVSSLVAKTLTLKNSATLNYDQGLASAQFTQGPGGSWALKKGTYRITN